MPRLAHARMLVVVGAVAGGASCASAQWAIELDQAEQQIAGELGSALDQAARQLREAHMQVAPAEPFTLRRRELSVGWAWGKEGVWLDRVSELFAARVDVSTLPRSARITAWTLGDGVVAAEIERDEGALIALPALYEGEIRFFDERGDSLDGKFVSRPVRGAFLASGFGKRTNPFTGRPGQMHTGVDLACARGTRVVSVGDGVVVTAGENALAGKYVFVRHHNGMRTKYFHLHKHADGVVAGKRVNAGELIGFVGSTGMSTGPHLHFEVMRDGLTIDPARVDWPSDKKLPKAALSAHKALAAQLRAMSTGDTYATWPPPTATATATTTLAQRE